MARPQRINIEGKRTRLQADRLRRWLMKWRSRLLVEHWTFRARIEPARHARDPRHTLVQVDVNERYADAMLRVYPRMFEEPVKEQERAVVHEMLHVPLNRIGNLLDRCVIGGLATREEVDDAWESFTEHLTNIVWDKHEG